MPAGNSSARKTWLEPTDALGPDVWMASREAGSDLAPSSPAVAAWRGLLSDADSRFDETDRMIANRTVQLEGMLREIGVRESAQDILRAFMPLAARAPGVATATCASTITISAPRAARARRRWRRCAMPAAPSPVDAE